MSNGKISIYDLSPVEEGMRYDDPRNPMLFSSNVVDILRQKDQEVEYPQELELPGGDTRAFNKELLERRLQRKSGPRPLTSIVRKFPDGETDISIPASVRDRDVFVFQSYIPPLGERILELGYFIDACKGGGDAHRVTVATPYLFGQRGERRTKPRQPLPALVFARMIDSNGGDHVLTICEHAQSLGSIYSALELGYDPLSFELLVANYILNDAQQRGTDEIVIGTPDIGAATRAGHLQDMVIQEGDRPARIVFANKRRQSGEKTRLTHTAGDVQGAHVYVSDDIGATMGSMVNAVNAYLAQGAESVDVLICHPVLSGRFGPPLDELCDNPQVSNIMMSNTMPLKGRALTDPKVKIVPFEPFVAEAIWRINKGESISALHRYQQIVQVYRDSQMPTNGKMVRVA